MRVFIGIDLSEQIKQECQRICLRLRELGLEGRFVRAESLHLTVRFLGEIEPETVPKIGQLLQETGRGLSPFSAGVGGLSVFPSRGRPRVVWVGVDRVDGLERLWTSLESGLQELGFPPERREYSPHLTLLRLKSGSGAGRLRQYLEAEGGGRLGSLEVSEVHLFRSILRPEGAQYRKEVTAQLGDSAPSGWGENGPATGLGNMIRRG